jgi:CRP-like cAMP-binding protein
MVTMTKIKPVNLWAEKKHRLITMDIFQSTSFEDLQEIERHMLVRKYARRESIFREDDQADFVWLVKQGHVKEIHHSEEGRHTTLCMVGAKGLFGISAFNGGSYGFDCMAESDATVLSFPIRSFQSLMGKYPEMGRIVVSEIAKLLRQSRNRQILSQESAEKRLLQVLVEMGVEFGDTIPLTRKLIASMAGTSVETCIRTFSRLKNAGLITSGNRKIMVKNAEFLKDWMDKL